jgi:creatinine amidohydrolase
MKLLEMSTHELAEAAPRLAFWPVGTIEAHDQGPLGTDVIAPQQLAEDLAPEFGALLLPTLPYGLVTSLSGYPGSMWVTPETYHQLVYELLSSLRGSSLRAVIVFNGHGGNTSILGQVLPEVWKEVGLKTAFIDWWTAAEDLSSERFGAAGGHGGADELAVVHAADPSLVPKTWDGSRAYWARSGLRAYPSPRSAIRFADGAVEPMTPESAAAFYADLKQRLQEMIQAVLAGWEIFEG